MAIPEKLTVRLGGLRQPLAAWCDQHQQKPSESVRIAVAAMLGVDAPEMPVGNPNASKQALAANAARWKQKRKTRKKRSKK